MKNNNTIKALKIMSVITAILIIIIIIFSIVNYTLFKKDLSAQIIAYGLPAILLISFLLEALPQITSAHAILLSAILLGVNSYSATIFVTIGAIIASLLSFWLGKIIEIKLLKKLMDEKTIIKVKKQTEKHGKWYATASAISPLPYIPILFAALGMSWKNFLIYGLIPRIIGFIFMGLLLYRFFN